MTLLREFGLRASGTRWYRQLVEANLDPVDVTRHTPYWTHGPLILDEEADGYLAMAKHPHAWLASVLHHYEQRELDRRPDPYLLADKWATTTASYLAAAEQRDDVALVRYIDLLRHPTLILERLADRFYLETPTRWEIPQRSTLPAGLEDVHDVDVDPSAGLDQAAKAYYEAAGWRTVLEVSDVQAMNAALWYLMDPGNGRAIPRHLGYHVPTTRHFPHSKNPYHGGQIETTV